MAAQTGNIRPEDVAAFAYLTVTTDEGTPIRPAVHHWLWLALLCDPHIKRLLIIAPPESAKTTWLVLAYLGLSIGVRPELPRILACSTGPVAKKRSLALRNLVTSEPFREIFPNVQLVQGRHRGDDGALTARADEWSVAPAGLPHAGRVHPTLAAYGTGGAITGSRGAEIIADDILDFENTRTAHQREQVHEWVHKSLLSRVRARTGRVLAIGNSWHHADTYARLKAQGDFVVCHMPLLAEGEGGFYATITYPRGWQYETLGEPLSREEVAV